MKVKANKKPVSGSIAEDGNAFFYILLGVALFAALSFSIARGIRTQSTNMLTRQEIKLAASDILDYAQKAGMAVQRVLRKGCSENDISFDSPRWDSTDYQHSPAVADKCQVFLPTGGGLQWRPAPDYAATGAIWQFQGNLAVEGVGSEPTGTSDPYGGELILLLSVKSKDLCMTINDGVEIANIIDNPTDGTRPPYNAGNINVFAPFQGTYTADFTLRGDALELIGKPTGCISMDNSKNAPNGPYVFYSTLLAR